MPVTKKSGFILYIVMAVLLGLAILAFALNSFKQGAVTQLARNVDQNRLATLAQSGNAEIIATIRSQVNDPDSEIFKRFRKIFPGVNNAPPLANLHEDIDVFADGVPGNFAPQQTLKIAENAGYPLRIKSRATLRIYRKAPLNSFLAYNGYLEVFSQAYREGSKDTVVEAYERRDVRLIDVRHSLDKYALFVKNFGRDYNNSGRRLMVNGIPPHDNDISRVYLGTGNYPACDDPNKNLWLDLFYEENRLMPGFKDIFGFSGLKEFPNGAEDSTVPGGDKIPRLFYTKKIGFKSLNGTNTNLFIKVPTLMNLYEKFVNEAANSCLKPEVVAYAVQDALKSKCDQAIKKLKNSNSYAQQICEDFLKNASGADYSSCSEFKKILKTCEEKWQFHYGYTDAAGVWQIDKASRPSLPPPHKWVTALYYRGLVDKTPPYGNAGPYFSEFLSGTGTQKFNPERASVGKMPQLYGEDNKTPVLVEGSVFLRFFKIAYLEDFVEKVEFLIPQEIHPEPVPILFLRPDRADKTFQNTPLGNNLAPSGYFTDNFMMSRPIDYLSVNTLLGKSVSYYDGDGKPATIDPLTSAHPTFPEPAKPAGSAATAAARGRLIDFQVVSRNYPSTADFYAERVVMVDGKKVLHIDGLMYVENGDLDLSDVPLFYGKGLIYLARGNCTLGNFARQRDPLKTSDSLRICLRQGDFIIQSSSEDVVVEASLIALYYPFGGLDQKSQGNLILGGRKTVTIIGNLLVDSLYTQDSGDAGLKSGGLLNIVHDPIIYNPAAEIESNQLDPYHISIGPVKSAFALNAGGKTF